MTTRELVLLGCMLVLFGVAMLRLPFQSPSPPEVLRISAPTGFVGFGTTQPQCPITIHADDGREACLDWRSGTVTYSGELPVGDAARLFAEELSTIAPWPPTCAQEKTQ